ncbi:MAG TPA: LptA/OstA family protein [Nitrospira sp.]|nr:LptA/OstA family protein [Nitrospira sp.]
MWIYLLLLNALVFGAAPLAHSAESGLAKKTGEAPAVSTTITAKKMTVRNKDSQAVFEGTVVLTRGPLIVYSDKMVVMFHSQDNDAAQPTLGGRDRGDQTKSPSLPKGSDAMPAVSNRSVSRVEATGHVKIEKENGNATCQKAVYFSQDEKIVLTGDPVAWEKGTRVSGKQITMYLAEDRSVVEGGSHVRIEGEGKSAP